MPWSTATFATMTPLPPAVFAAALIDGAGHLDGAGDGFRLAGRFGFAEIWLGPTCCSPPP